MANIECPQCHSEITTCSHCGFPLDDAVVQTEQEKPKSPLGTPIRNMPFGLTFIIAGVLGLIGSLALMLSMLVFGLGFFIISALVMALGVNMIIGHVEAECPFCNQKLQIATYAQGTTCRHCKTVSVCKDNYLELL